MFTSFVNARDAAGTVQIFEERGKKRYMNTARAGERRESCRLLQVQKFPEACSIVRVCYNHDFIKSLSKEKKLYLKIANLKRRKSIH